MTAEQMTIPDLFTATGIFLYGPQFRSELGRELGYDERQIRRWCDGEYLPPIEVWRKLEDLCRYRLIMLKFVKNEIETHLISLYEPNQG